MDFADGLQVLPPNSRVKLVEHSQQVVEFFVNPFHFDGLLKEAFTGDGEELSQIV